MTTSHQPPEVGPPPEGTTRPFWSVMIPVWNRVDLPEKTLRSVLAQDPGPGDMQIEVVDDASTQADPEPMVRRVGGDRVGFFRQPRNLGMTANWNNCIERARGEWVHILHSDDYVLPGFYHRLREGIEKRADLGAAFCRVSFVDENDAWKYDSALERDTPGVLPGFLERLAVVILIQFSAMIVRRSVYEQLGGFRTDLAMTMDWEMWIRIAARYPIWYEPSILAAFRLHSNSWTTSLIRSGTTIRDEQRCIEMVRPLLPAERADAISRQARELASLRALSTAGAAFGKAKFGTAYRQAWEALKCSPTPRVFQSFLFGVPALLAKGGIRRTYRAARRGMGLAAPEHSPKS